MTQSTTQPVGDRPDDLWAKVRAAYDALMAEREHLRVLLNRSRSTVTDFDLLTQIHQSLGLTTPATREDGASGADGEREAVEALVRRWANWIIFESSDGEAEDHGAGERKILGERDRILAALRPLSPDQPSARERRLEEALAKAVEAVSDAIEWDKQRGYRMPYRVRDPLYAVLATEAKDGRAG